MRLLARLTGPDAAVHRQRLSLNEDSSGLVLSTEDPTDPANCLRIVPDSR